MLETYQQSVDYLIDRKSLLIFPEVPDQEVDPKTQMKPFKKGFTRLGEFYFEETGKSLSFYPVTVHSGLRRVKVGKPETLSARKPRPNERLRLKKVMAASIRDM